MVSLAMNAVVTARATCSARAYADALNASDQDRNLGETDYDQAMPPIAANSGE